MKRLALVARGIICALVLLWTVSCDDNSVGPQPGDKQYLVYFYSAPEYDGSDIDTTPRFMSYDPYTNVVDTFMLPLVPKNDMGISPDGRLLYVPTASNVAVVNTHRKQVITELPYANVVGVAASKYGNRLAVYGPELWILDADTYDLIYHDSIEVRSGSFSDSGDRFYYARGRDGACMLTLGKYPEQHCGRITTPYGFLTFTQVDGNETNGQWITYSRYASEQWLFSAFDPAGDSLVFVDQLEPGGGEFTVTPDDRLVFYNNPGGRIGSYAAPPEISVFDVQSQTVLARISTLRYVDSVPIEGMYCDDLAITPDGKWLVGTSRFGQDTIVLINIETLSIERYIDLGNHPWLYSAVCQGRT